MLARNEFKPNLNTALNIYDTYDIYGLLALEALGLAKRGKSLEVVDKMPYLNVGGGLKARGRPVGATPNIVVLADEGRSLQNPVNQLRGLRQGLTAQTREVPALRLTER
jgi:acetyl-CoA acetyltransferase